METTLANHLAQCCHPFSVFLFFSVSQLSLIGVKDVTSAHHLEIVPVEIRTTVLVCKQAYLLMYLSMFSKYFTYLRF